MKLHQRGIDLLLNLQDVIEHVDKLSPKEIADILKEAETVLRDLLARDVPSPDTN